MGINICSGELNLKTDVVDTKIRETALIIYACSAPLINASSNNYYHLRWVW